VATASASRRNWRRTSHGQDEQGEQHQWVGHDEQRVRQPAARAHEVGLRAGRGGAGPDAGHGQRDDPKQDKTQRSKSTGWRMRRSS
jgi:hypothetical protein